MAPQILSIAQDDLDVDRALSTEWLETNGLGDYASSTLTLCPTRRYHGLLVARPPGSTKRHVLLSRFDEIVTWEDGSFALSMARYPGAFAPAGGETLRSFELAPHPRAVHASGPVVLAREVMMVRGERTTLLRYEVRSSGAPLELRLRPFLPYREADALTFRNESLRQGVEPAGTGIRLAPYQGLPPLGIWLGSTPFRFEAEPVWYEHLELVRERERGYPWQEDHFSPGALGLTLDEGQAVVLAVSIEGEVADPETAWEREHARRSRAWKEAEAATADRATARAAFAASDFLVRDRDTSRPGVNAGYPWFGEWGRDTFVALPGLTLALGRLEQCEEVLSGAVDYLNDGLLPNVYGRSRTDSHYGSIDAALWFARAVHLYERAGGSSERVIDELLPALREIADAYWSGTALSRPAGDDGLIDAGVPERNVTWMDAVCSSGPATPRDGCAVEVNALWYALLQHLERLLEAAGDRPAKREWSARRRRLKKSFVARFWLPDGEYLADRWKDGKADASVRPNMVIAAALEDSPLKKDQRAGVVRRAENELLTARGLRTLSPEDPGYLGRYAGDPEQRDRAYHQGTVWPWLLGFHCEATLRALGTKRAVRDRLSALWDEVAGEMDSRGLNHVSEVFDGDPPHAGGGTIAQAWNTAELLRSRAMLAGGLP